MALVVSRLRRRVVECMVRLLLCEIRLCSEERQINGKYR